MPNVFLTELGPIFSRLSQSELLSRCLLGLTQNQNESLNGLLWARLSKTAFCGRRKVKIGVCETVCVANTGAASKAVIMEKAGIDIGSNMLKGLRYEDKMRIKNAACKISLRYRKRRKQLKFNKVKSKAKKVSYKAGSFGLTSRPDEGRVKKGNKSVIAPKPNQKTRKEVLLKKCRKRKLFEVEQENVLIKFVSDDDISIIKHFKNA